MTTHETGDVRQVIEQAWREGYDFGQADAGFDECDADDAWSKSGTLRDIETLTAQPAPSVDIVWTKVQSVLGTDERTIERVLRDAMREVQPAPSGWQPIAEAQVRCERVAKGLELALTFPSRLLLDTAVRESIKELRALPPASDAKDADVAGDEALIDKGWEQLKAADIAAKGSPRDIARGALDPIRAAVDAQLDPLKDELTAIGHKLEEQTRDDS
jgi:hypothetical protein